MSIHALGKDACYSDTDSIKYVGEYDDYFERVNNNTMQTMQQVCAMYNLDYDLFYDLGSFEKEYEGKEVKAKFLGAKRYIIKDDSGYHVTIAGLPKKALQKYFDSFKIQHEIYQYGSYPDMFDLFEHNMFLEASVSLKNAHTYNDAPHTNDIEGVKCYELSSVGIYPIDFTMKLSDFYLSLIAMQQEGSEQYESRIY